uniref:Uncharacterized protein n=1 Tax=Hyaloperonospora arabidopsidis (strain Emoy2) TaxID=559515 RepID=M4BTX8_HYAAE
MSKIAAQDLQHTRTAHIPLELPTLSRTTSSGCCEFLSLIYTAGEYVCAHTRVGETGRLCNIIASLKGESISECAQG